MSLTERIHSDHGIVKHLGDWTAAGRFEVKARQGLAVLDLRSAGLPDDIEIHLDMDRAMIKLLVDDETAIDHWNLSWTARGRIKNVASPRHGDKAACRMVHLSGSAMNSEIRVHRGGVALLSAMFSRAYVRDVCRAHRTGGVPTVDDPMRGHRS
ncbi:hypothetical protein [Streptomyces malaysiense]|uniref:Uncharacterized protein n=1 Tax=Streptomyces malaysiense TaxID=1428626 RepID=A0A1J4Q066_9ACTN|nr:hypothetical protein [Streptomyces malaysiense]OIK26565.1 hypothetical protein VT52_016150 [Streptomyces malaysiense]